MGRAVGTEGVRAGQTCPNVRTNACPHAYGGGFCPTGAGIRALMDGLIALPTYSLGHTNEKLLILHGFDWHRFLAVWDPNSSATDGWETAGPERVQQGLGSPSIRLWDPVYRGDPGGDKGPNGAWGPAAPHNNLIGWQL